MNPHAPLLRQLDANAKILVAADKDGIGHCAISGEGHQVRDDSCVDALLLAMAIYDAEPELDIRGGCKQLLICGQADGKCAVIPIDA